jgi:hypothetical protein
MDAAEKALRATIDRHLPSPTHMELAVSGDRVLDDLRSTPAHLQQARIDDTPSAVSPWRQTMSAAAAAVLLAAVIGTAILWPRGAEVYAAGADGLQFTLVDDSRVEMRAHSELKVDRTADGIRIDLKKGGIIVNAAKQRTGHLYVQTKDLTVSVVGTVFLVNAEDAGSRVAVIEGEVRVHEGRAETTLRPGEHKATNPALAVRPVAEEIGWSRHADIHRAMLATFARGMALSAGPLRPLTDAPGSANAAFDHGGAAAAQTQPAASPPQFEEASLRPCNPDNIPAPPVGARGGGANSFMVTPGRMHALCLTVATLVRTAYGYGPVDVEFLNAGGGGRGRV